MWFLVVITDTRCKTAQPFWATWEIEAKVRKVIANYSDLFSIIRENQVELTK